MSTLIAWGLLALFAAGFAASILSLVSGKGSAGLVPGFSASCA